jgi:hypothetical protein
MALATHRPISSEDQTDKAVRRLCAHDSRWLESFPACETLFLASNSRPNRRDHPTRFELEMVVRLVSDFSKHRQLCLSIDDESV